MCGSDLTFNANSKIEIPKKKKRKKSRWKNNIQQLKNFLQQFFFFVTTLFFFCLFGFPLSRYTIFILFFTNLFEFLFDYAQVQKTIAINFFDIITAHMNFFFFILIIFFFVCVYLILFHYYSLFFHTYFI